MLIRQLDANLGPAKNSLAEDIVQILHHIRILALKNPYSLFQDVWAMARRLATIKNSAIKRFQVHLLLDNLTAVGNALFSSMYSTI